MTNPVYISLVLMKDTDTDTDIEADTLFLKHAWIFFFILPLLSFFLFCCDSGALCFLLVFICLKTQFHEIFIVFGPDVGCQKIATMGTDYTRDASSTVMFLPMFGGKIPHMGDT